MSPASLEGQTLGKYRILEPLGQGGMARVYRAYHPKLERYVAIKVLRSDLIGEEEFLARFRREAQAVAGLRHPNIVQVFDFDEQDEIYYMVMEQLQGDTLKARLNGYRAAGQSMPYGEMLKILCDVLDGLGYAHGEGIIHRDIKPANIMLTRRGQAVITDFGIIQIIGGTNYTISGALMGTLNYMAPEQGLHGTCDVRSDLYSLGIVFYEMLTGHTPFEADTPLAILMKHVNDPLPLPSKLKTDVPEALESVILKTLSKKADDRYQSTGEMKTALIEAAQEAGISIPERVSVPESLIAKSVSAGAQVAVLSGTERQKLGDIAFAADDTDGSLAAKLKSGVANPPASASQLNAEVQPPAEALGFASLGGAISTQAQTPAADPAVTSVGAGTREPDSSHPVPSTAEVAAAGAALAATFKGLVDGYIPRDRRLKWQQRLQKSWEDEEKRRPNVAMAGVSAGAIIVIPTLLAVTYGGVFNQMGLLGRGFPAEILLVALAMAVMMRALDLIWMFIPVNILTSTGLILAFYTITHLWGLWFLWPLQGLVLFGTILFCIQVGRQKESSKRVARLAAMLMSITNVLALVVLTPLFVLITLLAGK